MDTDRHNADNWKNYYSEGKRYLEIVKVGLSNSKKFTPEILYNIACMSIEKLFMAYFIKVRKMPYNHTLFDLVNSMNEIENVPEELSNELLYMNDFQEICSIEQYSRKIPLPSDIERFAGTLDKTELFIQSLVE